MTISTAADYVRVSFASLGRWQVRPTAFGPVVADCTSEQARDAAYRLLSGRCEAELSRSRAGGTIADWVRELDEALYAAVKLDIAKLDGVEADNGLMATMKKVEAMADEAKSESESVDESVQVDSSSVRVHGVWVGGVVDERYGERVAVALSKALTVDRTAQKTHHSQMLAKIRETIGCEEGKVFEAIERMKGELFAAHRGIGSLPGESVLDAHMRTYRALNESTQEGVQWRARALDAESSLVGDANAREALGAAKGESLYDAAKRAAASLVAAEAKARSAVEEQRFEGDRWSRVVKSDMAALEKERDEWKAAASATTAISTSEAANGDMRAVVKGADPRVTDLAERVAKLEYSEHNHTERLAKIERCTPSVSETPRQKRPLFGGLHPDDVARSDAREEMDRP